MQETWEIQIQALGQEDSPGGGHGNPLQYSCLENPMDRGSLVGCSPQNHTESDTTKVAKQQQQQHIGLVTMQHVESSGPEIKPMSAALADRFLTTGPPGKFCMMFFVFCLYVCFSLASQMYSDLLWPYFLIKAWTVQACMVGHSGPPCLSHFVLPSSPVQNGAKPVHSWPTLAPRKSTEMNGN